MKIIEEGSVPTYKQRCNHCKTLFEFTLADTKRHAIGSVFCLAFWRTVVCPKCSVNIEVEQDDDDD